MTRIQSRILVGCFLRDMSRNELDCKNYKSCKVLSWGNKKDENNKYDQNCKKLGEGQNESAQGPRLKNAETDKNDESNKFDKKLQKIPNGDQNERACVNRCNKNIIINNEYNKINNKCPKHKMSMQHKIEVMIK